jgi:hypothetical protein
MPLPTAKDRFFSSLKNAFYENSFIELTLEKYQGLDRRMRSIIVRPDEDASRKASVSFTHIHSSHETVQIHTIHEALDELQKLTGKVFLETRLITKDETIHLCFTHKHTWNLTITPHAGAASPESDPVDETPPPSNPGGFSWCHALDTAISGVTARHHETPGLQQISEFIYWLAPLAEEAGLVKTNPGDSVAAPFPIVHLGCNPGHFAFATAAFFGARTEVRGIDENPELVAKLTRIARAEQLSNLTFSSGSIAETPLNDAAMVIAMHACDTATDDIIAKSIAAGSAVIVVSPCCHEELLPQLNPVPGCPPMHNHNRLHARQTGFVTDVFRTLLLEWTGYKTKTFELSTAGHTCSQLLLAAVKPRIRRQNVFPDIIHDFARFHGIRTQRLARHLGLDLH